jgi:hypothetical protein
MHTTTTETQGIVAAAPGRPMSFGEQAVGLSFNPSSDPAVYQCKSGLGQLIDQMDELRRASTSNEQKRLASIAITELQGAQMWAVKALTWKD